MQKNLSGRDCALPKTAKRAGSALWTYAKGVFLSPFRENLFFFVIVWITAALPSCWWSISKGRIKYAFYVLAAHYVLAYLCSLPAGISRKAGAVVKIVVFDVLCIVCVINLYCIIMLDSLLSVQLLYVLLGTNPAEVFEFLTTYVPWTYLALFLIILIAINVFVAYCKGPRTGKAWTVGMCVLFASAIASTHNAGMVRQEFFDSPLFHLHDVIDLNNHLTHPSIAETDSIHPQNIVVILGESFTPGQSSLYGYGRKTNPLLAKREEEGSLIVFRNVTSPMTNTTATFQYILNTRVRGEEGETEWYEHTTLIEAMSVAGYHTSWISNQSERGVYDNLPSGHAKICDEKNFTETHTHTKQPDGELFLLDFHDKGKNLVFFHLMGQHVEFSKRYPKEFDLFKAEEYSQYPENQRSVRAAYDNATLYNDYVVNALIDRFKDKDAVVFYFSDHGLDFFKTDPDWAGHAKQNAASEREGRNVPFMVYVSPSFQTRRPELADELRRCADVGFCTDTFIYMAMDMAGYRFADNNDVEERSVLRKRMEPSE